MTTLPTPTEHAEQCALVERCLYSGYPYNLIFAIPNAGKRSIGAAQYMRAEGLRAGVPDLLLPVARGGYMGLFCELKVGRNKPSPEQTIWIDNLRAEGYCVAVCYGQDRAWQIIEEYVLGGFVRDRALEDRILERI